MNISKNINKLLDKYHKNECNYEEIEIIERFFSKLQENCIDPETVKKDLYLKNKIYQNIQQKITLKRKRSKWINSASAAAAILIGVLVLTQFWNKTPDATIVVVEAKFGEQLQVTLSDASIVHLNSGSSLSYPDSFENLESRTVKLKGEGFFEITKNPEKPFIVESGAIRTKVLGTKFVVNTFKTDLPEVIVTEGKVNVTVAGRNTTTINILPNEKVVYDLSANNFIKTKVLSENYAAWIHGDVVFNDSNIKDIGEKLERRFNIKVVLDPGTTMDCLLSGKYSGDRLTELLESIHFVNGLEYHQTKDTLHLQKINCP